MPKFVGITVKNERPTAIIAMNDHRDLLCDDPDWLAELAIAVKHACTALLTERARDAQALAMKINEETHGDPETSGTSSQAQHPGG
jgi:hypothetical protein